MNCADSRELLIEYSLGQLDPSRTIEVREHLSEGCPVCADKLSQITETWASFAASLDPVKPSPEVERKLLAMIRGQVAPPAEFSFSRVNGGERSRVLAYVLAASLMGTAAAILAWKFLPLSAMLGEREVAIAPAEDWGAPTVQSAGPGFQTVALVPIAEKQGVHLSVAMNQAAEQWHVIGTGLPATVGTDFYQIWFETKAGSFKPAEKLPIDKFGRGGVIVDLSIAEQAELASVWLTLEKSVAGERPSGNILFRAAIK